MTVSVQPNCGANPPRHSLPAASSAADETGSTQIVPCHMRTHTPLALSGWRAGGTATWQERLCPGDQMCSRCPFSGPQATHPGDLVGVDPGLCLGASGHVVRGAFLLALLLPCFLVRHSETRETHVKAFFFPCSFDRTARTCSFSLCYRCPVQPFNLCATPDVRYTLLCRTLCAETATFPCALEEGEQCDQDDRRQWRQQQQQHRTTANPSRPMTTQCPNRTSGSTALPLRHIL